MRVSLSSEGWADARGDEGAGSASEGAGGVVAEAEAEAGEASGAEGGSLRVRFVRATRAGVAIGDLGNMGASGGLSVLRRPWSTLGVVLIFFPLRGED
jgi:hypothetical protein